MKIRILILAMLFTTQFLLFTICCHAQNWQWAKHIGSDYSMYGERPNSIITDGLNYYMIGSYGGTLYLPVGTLQSNGNNDIFIIKFDFNGNQIWAKTLGGSYMQPDAHEDASGVYDPVNNCIYIAGSYINSINFGSGINLLTSHYNTADVFVAKMDLSGNFIWAKQGGSTGNDKANVFAEPDGDILLVGNLWSAGNIDTLSIEAGGFFARFDSNGNLKWAAHKFSGFASPRISFLGSDIIMAGAFETNPSSIDTVTMVPVGVYDGFITRMDSVGEVKWLKKFGSYGQDGFSGINISNINEIYAVGFFNDTITIDGQTLSNTGNDILITKFNQNGGLIWAKQAHANGNSQGANAVITDINNNFYITGLFEGNASFGNYNVSTTNPFDMFLARYDSSGYCLGVIHFGQAGSSCLTQDNLGNVVCAGAFHNTVNIGDSAFTSYGAQDIFVAKATSITGISELHKTPNNNLLIYANPTTGKCNITVPDDFLNETNLTLSIFDNSGKLIQQKKLEMNDGKIKVDLDAEAKGIYTAVLSNGKKSYTGKIVFE